MQGKRITIEMYPNGGGFKTPQPGEYGQLPDGSWYAGTPNGHSANLSAHQVTEHEDGTITVSPSILVSRVRTVGDVKEELWHGYLERGVWRSC